MFHFPIKCLLILSIAHSSLCKDTYIIQIPSNVNITEEGTITVNILENDLNPYQTLYIDFDEEFVINDAHGKQDIQGYTTNSSISFQADDLLPKQVFYHLPHIPAGSWSGDLSLSIRLDSQYPSNILIDGRQLNSIISSYGPTTVEFSNDVINSYDDVIDVSLAQDGSVNLYEIDSLNKIIISNSTNSAITANEDMSDLFKDVTTLNEIINIDLLDLSECKSISGMFNGANRLSSIGGLSDLITDNIEDMSFLFASTNRLRNIDLSDWDTGNVKDMSYMFNSSYINDFSSIEEWDVGSVEDMNNMFSQSKQVTSLDLSSWDVSEVKDMSNMFSSIRNITSIDISSWNTGNCLNMSEMFASSQRLTSINGISVLNTANVKDMSSMFSTCTGLSVLDLSSWNVEEVEDMSLMFNSLNITDLGDLSGWDVSEVTTFSGMFRNCQRLTSLFDLSDWNVSDKCTDLSSMFYATDSILPSALDLSGWDVSNVTDMSEMFYGCKSLEYLDITDWDTGNLISAYGMFQYNSTSSNSILKNIIGIEDIDTRNLKNISHMFMLNRFVNVDLSSWNTESLEDISYAFSGCYRQDLDKLKHWNVSSVTDMNNCFADNAGSLSGTSVPDWYLN